MQALPRLGGHWLTAYKLVWAVALLGAITGCIAVQIQVFQPVRLLHALVLGSVAAMLFRRRPGDPIAAMLSLAFLLWTLTRSAEVVASAGAGLELLDRVRFALFVVAMMLFPGGRFDPPWTLHAVAATFVVAGIGMLAAAGLIPGPIYVVPAMACAALAVIAMRERFRALPPGVQRQQIKWVALGVAIGLGFVLVSRIGSIFLPAALAPMLFDLGVILMALGVLVSLLRYRLYDADAAISRSAAYAGLTVALLAVFGASEATLQLISQNWLANEIGPVSSAVAAGIAAALVVPAHQLIGDWTRACFQRHLTLLRRDLPELLEDLRGFADLDCLADAVLQQIERGLRPVRSALILEGRVIGMRHVDSSVAERLAAEPWSGAKTSLQYRHPLFPVRWKLMLEGRGVIGWIMLGPRPDGTMYGKDENEALKAILPPIARALFGARLRSRKETAEAQRMNEVLRELECVNHRLDLLEHHNAASSTSSKGNRVRAHHP